MERNVLDGIEGQMRGCCVAKQIDQVVGEAIVQGTAVSRATTPKPCMGKKL